MRIVLNKCYGGYCLSEEAYKFLGLNWDKYGFAYDDDRTNEKLINCVETLGCKANGLTAELMVIDIPDDIDYEIESYDGYETVEEKHRSW